ncbi:MAG: dimethylsulfonioproprionate lyase family protein [Minwuiales bacterium]|nr:dimethylsulfonioproprionate lyase family protein [Minwuiales bacterium]
MKSAVRQFADEVAEMYLAKLERLYAPREELEEFAGLLSAVDWSGDPVIAPPAGDVPGLRHIPAALSAAYEAGDCPVLDALRLCIGLTPWETFYSRSEWSSPFIDSFASGELVGPNGFMRNKDVSLGLFVLGPQTTYSEHAHASIEIYYVLGGEAFWRLDSPDWEKRYKPGDLVFTSAHQRHEIRTGDLPMLAAYTWKADPSSPSYYRSEGPWRGGRRTEPVLVNR